MSEMWGVLELMGHVRVAGRITEEERFGGKLGRIDIPKRPDPACVCEGTGKIGEGDAAHECGICTAGFTTQYFNAASIYRLTPTTEEAARAVAQSCQPSPVHTWELPRPALPHVADECDDPDDIPFR